MAVSYESKDGRTWTKVVDERASVAPPTSDSAKSSTPAVTEAEKDAKKEFSNNEKKLITGDVDIFPNPRIRAGKTVKIEGVGKNLSGLYYVEKVSHTFSSEGYRMTLTVRSNAIGDGISSTASVAKPVPAPKDNSAISPALTPTVSRDANRMPLQVTGSPALAVSNFVSNKTTTFVPNGNSEDWKKNMSDSSGGSSFGGR